MNWRPHTSQEYERELGDVRRRLATMGGEVEALIQAALGALLRRESELARQAIQREEIVNSLEIEIDELVHRILATRQPVGADLRFLTVAIRATTDLERVGDIGVNLAERALAMDGHAVLPHPGLHRLGQAANSMLTQALNALVNEDAETAMQVIGQDPSVDAENARVFQELLHHMGQEGADYEALLAQLFAAKHLERVADHATNLAEQVVFLVQGRDIRHPRRVQVKKAAE